MRPLITFISNDHVIRQVIAMCLNVAGWQVFHDDYDHTDLDSLKDLHPDLVILDLTDIEQGDSWTFLQEFQSDPTTTHIPVLITALDTSLTSTMHNYLLSRYVPIIPQPLDLEVCVELVRQTLVLARKATIPFLGTRSQPILLVEDTVTLREMCAKMLTLEGYQVVTAENGLRALEAIYRADHCLIFLDMNMPIMDGFEFLRCYNQQLRPHTSVIVFSAEVDIYRHVFPSFVVDVVSKPFKMSQLLSLVERHVQPIQ